MGKAAGLGFFHDAGAMDLRGPRAYAQFSRDDFVRLAVHQQAQHLGFPKAQRSKACGRFLRIGRDCRPLLGCAAQSVPDCRKQIFRAKGFFEKVLGSELHGVNGEGNVRLRGNQNDGQAQRADGRVR